VKAHIDISHEGSIDHDGRVRMQIDSDSTAFLMSILTDLYSDPELAVIREYSTNALDSHRAAGNPDPIEVELPTSLWPVFVVRDRGVGMSVDEITHHFSKYGWSSKRDTDGEVGMLGLGCKSGLTYSSQFTFIAIKDGVRATVLVTRDPDGGAALQVLDTMGTSEPNGVEVQIPVHHAHTFIRKAQDFYRFWEKGTVLVDGEPPEHIGDVPSVLRLDDDVILVPELRHSYIVMGNVPYPVPDDELITGRESRVVAWVPIGSVDFTPSREALHMTRRTKEVISELRTFIGDSTFRKAQADVQAAPNHWEALRCAQKWRKLVSGFQGVSLPLTYRGDRVPKATVYVNSKTTLYWHALRDESTSDRRLEVSVRDVETSVFLVGHHGKAFTRLDKRRMQKWLTDHDISLATMVFALPELPNAPWFDAGATVVHLDELRQVSTPRPETPVSQTPDGYYRVLNHRGELVHIRDLRPEVVWVPATLPGGLNRPEMMRVLSSFDISVVPVSKGREDRFVKENPSAVYYLDFARALVYLAETSFTPVERTQVALQYKLIEGGFSVLKKRKDEILDPVLAEVVELSNPAMTANDIPRWGLVRKLCQIFPIPLPPIKADPVLASKISSCLKHYELLGELRYNTDWGKVLRYVNLVYSSSVQPVI
jgi:hypothetical protein